MVCNKPVYEFTNDWQNIIKVKLGFYEFCNAFHNLLEFYF